jgi:hypothetical protein
VKGLPSSKRCVSGRASVNITLPNNTTSSTKSYRFYLTARRAGGTGVERRVMVVEHAPARARVAPVITTQPTNQSMVSGTVVFYAAASGNPTPSVQWQFSPPWDGGATWLNIPGATSTSYTFVASAIDDEGNLYRAVFTNVAGSATTNAALLTVAGPWPTPTQSGYIDFAFPAMFSEVQASWTVPTVTCPPGSTNTWVEQWPAISGSGNSIVQDGTGATCASGSPVYFAWWAIGGDPNITGGQPYAQFLDPSQYPVSAGDAINASVSISGSTWTLQVNDTTQNWTFTSNTPNTSPGLGQGEASVIVEGNSACYPPRVMDSRTSALSTSQGRQLCSTVRPARSGLSRQSRCRRPTAPLCWLPPGSRSGGRRVGLKDFLVLQEMLRSWRPTSWMKRSMVVGMQ